MRVVGNEYVGAGEEVIANSDAVDGRNMASVAEEAIVSNGKTGTLVAPFPNRHLEVGAKDVAIAYIDVALPLEMLCSPNEGGTPHPCKATSQIACIDVIARCKEPFHQGFRANP